MNLLQIPCLGVPFKLGMLYDCRTNKPIPGKTLWNDEALCISTLSSSRFELVSEDTFNQKAFLLGAGADLQLSLLSGLVHADGAAQVLYDHKTSKNMSRVILSYKTTNTYEEIDPPGVLEFSEEEMATHVVTRVMYGADAFFVFDQKIDKDDDVKAAQKIMEQKFRKLISPDGQHLKSIDSSISLIAENEDENKLTCRYYGDAALPSYPTTFQEAIKVCQELPDLIKDESVAKKAWLLPLAELDTSYQRYVCEVSSPLVQSIQELLESMNEAEISTNDLIQSEACLYFTGILEELICIKSSINAYTLCVKGKIARLLPQIRAGEVPMETLRDVSSSFSPLSQKSLCSLINDKEQEITCLRQFLDCFKQKEPELVPFAFKDGELDSICDSNDACHVVCFDFNIHWGSHDIMEAYSQGENANWKEPATASEPWYTGHVLETIQNRIDLFTGHVEANRNRQGVKYVVTNGQSKLAKQATDKVAVISLYQDSSLPTQFEPISPPGKPYAKTVTSEGVELVWEAPKHGSTAITSYTVNYSFEPNKWLHFKVHIDRYMEEIVFPVGSLTPNTTYRFMIRAENAHGFSPDSLTSDSITTKPPVILKEKYLKCCNKPIEEGIPKVYKLPTHTTFQSDIFEITDALGAPSFLSASFTKKVVMLIGATGSGKTTLINAMTNYILGVEWEDDYRYKLITENTSDDQTKSQTKLITAYTFHKEEGFPFHYSLTVIDTPGFDDTEGLERDKKITAQIKEFFCSTKYGIDQLHAVCFVVPSSLPRLTPTQKYVFNAILSIFGKNMENNILLMTTFANGEEPHVLDAIRKAEVPIKEYFEFNNLAHKSRRADLNVPFWDMGVENFQKFFKALSSLEPCSLQLTQKVLTERKHLEVCLEGLQPQIQAGLNERSKLENTKHELEQREADMRANKDFTIKVQVKKQREIPLEGGLFTTTCLKCKYTCHLHCTISDDDKKHKCHAMTWLTKKSNTMCTVCPGKCSWTDHRNKPFRYEFYETEETQNRKEILDRYQVAESDKNRLENLVDNINQRISEADDAIEQMLQQARKSLLRLQEIALKPNPMSQEEYIEKLIVAEEQEHKPGWQDRVKGLEGAKKKASMITKVAKGDVASFYIGPARPIDDPHERRLLNAKAPNALERVGKQVDKIV